MAFGKKALQVAAPKHNGNGFENPNKDTFFPTASGKNGEPMVYGFRILEDEQVYTAREWAGQVTVNGKSTFRSCLVGYGNPFDTEAGELWEEIKNDESISEKDRSKVFKDRGGKWTKTTFFVNVLSRVTGGIQVLKGGYQKPKTDAMGNGVYDDKSTFGKLMNVKYRMPNPENRKVAVEVEPTAVDTELTCSGQGQFGKSYKFDATLNDEALTEDEMNLPRFDLETWVNETGIWPNDALERLKNGEEYYKLVEEYGIKLYPELRELVAVGESEEGTEVTNDDIPF